MAATRCSSSLAPSAGQPRFRARAATRRGRIRSAAGGFEDRSVIATLLMMHHHSIARSGISVPRSIKPCRSRTSPSRCRAFIGAKSMRGTANGSSTSPSITSGGLTRRAFGVPSNHKHLLQHLSGLLPRVRDCFWIGDFNTCSGYGNIRQVEYLGYIGLRQSAVTYQLSYGADQQGFLKNLSGSQLLRHLECPSVDRVATSTLGHSGRPVYPPLGDAA